MDVPQQTINGNLTKIDKEPCKVINSSDTPEQWKKVHWKSKQKKKVIFLDGLGKILVWKIFYRKRERKKDASKLLDLKVQI